MNQTLYERDAYDETADSGNGILGQHLKCAKGKWLLDGEEIATGNDGAKVCVIITSATTGQILWRDGAIVERDIGRLEDGFHRLGKFAKAGIHIPASSW